MILVSESLKHLFCLGDVSVRSMVSAAVAAALAKAQQLKGGGKPCLVKRAKTSNSIRSSGSKLEPEIAMFALQSRAA